MGPPQNCRQAGPWRVLTPHPWEHFLELQNLPLERIYHFFFAVSEFDLGSQMFCLLESSCCLA